MSETQTSPAGAAAETTEGVNLLEQVLSASKQTEPDLCA